MTTPSENAAALISRHFAAAAGVSLCSLPSSPMAATTSSCASGCNTKERAAIRSVDISREFKRSEEHTSELQSRGHLVCRLLLEKKKTNRQTHHRHHPTANVSRMCAPRASRRL